jgi:hypothetical protein
MVRSLTNSFSVTVELVNDSHPSVAGPQNIGDEVAAPVEPAQRVSRYLWACVVLLAGTSTGCLYRSWQR